MGNAQARSQPPSQLDNASQYRTFLLEYTHQTANIVYIKLIGDGKFLKTIHCNCEGGALIVKIYRTYKQNEDLSFAESALKKISSLLRLDHQPNLLPYADYQLSTKSNVAFLVRQYFLYNLYDRFSTRPFLTSIEKKWIAFQLLHALEQSHSAGVCHGDIKAENIMVTSWNWIFLTDFAPFKPTYLPEDDPADFYYYYCASDASRGSCSLAPERFYGSSTTRGPDAMFLSTLADSTTSAEEVDRQAEILGSGNGSMANRIEGRMRESMDVFSMGCVIGEIFLNGKAIFDLPTLLRYRTGDESALSILKKIKSQNARDLVQHMLQLNPHDRLSATEYRKQSTGDGKLFPEYFDSFMFRFMNLILTRPARVVDARIRLVCKYYDRILKEVAGTEDPEGVQFFQHRLQEGFGANKSPNDNVAFRVYEEIERGRMGFENEEKSSNVAEIDSTEKLCDIKQKIVDTLDKKNNWKASQEVVKDIESTESKLNVDNSMDESMSMPPFPQPIKCENNPDNGIILILGLLCSSIRHAIFPQSRLTGLQLITRLALFTDDEARLQRLIPFVMEVVEDSSASIRATAIRSLTSILAMITTLSPSDASVFPQYILPVLSQFPSDSDELVRIAFAECLPKIAEVSRYFLDIVYAMKYASNLDNTLNQSDTPRSRKDVKRNKQKRTKGSTNGLVGTRGYDHDLSNLHQMISRLVIRIAAPDQKASSSLVKRALLQDITRLCIFFGRERTLDVVLPQLITFLNDRDWELRAAFFEHIAGVCAFIGRVSLEMYILPCIEQALIDVQEVVIARALHCLATICELGLFQKHALIEKAKTTAPLFFHPGWWIRGGVVHLFVAIAKQLGNVDVYAFLVPIVQPYLDTVFPGKILDEETLRNSLRPPVSRETFDTALIASDTKEDPFTSIHGMESFIAVDKDGMETNNSIQKADGRGSLTEQSTNRSSQALYNRTEKNRASMITEEYERLQMMEKYVEVASMHMRSKLQLARSEHAARLHGDDSKKSTSYSRKLPRHLLHKVAVPDMRFALLHQPPLRIPSKVTREIVGIDSNEKKTATVSSKIEALSRPYLIGLYGLKATESHPASGYQQHSDLYSNDGYSDIRNTHKSGKKSTSRVDTKEPAVMDSQKLRSRLISLDIPPLPPELGALETSDGSKYSIYSVPGAISGGLGQAATPNTSNGNGSFGLVGKPVDVCYPNWKPREGVLVASLNDHSGAVNRLVVPQDFSFMASGSADGTIKIWNAPRLTPSHGTTSTCKFTYTSQKGIINDMVICENSHSIASASSNGTVHVFRVDRSGSTVNRIRKIELDESIVSIDHMNNISESVIAYATHKGNIYGWDLRFRRMAWTLRVSPELGYITCMTHGTDSTWLAAGTSRGYITIWDLRFQILVKIWRHTSHDEIRRMIPCLGLPPNKINGLSSNSLPLLYVAAGINEAAVWDISKGVCRAVFRTLQSHITSMDESFCPGLESIPIPIHSSGEFMESILGPQNQLDALRLLHTESELHKPAIRAILSPCLHLRGVPDSIITGGDDGQIRYWDLKSAKNSFTISGVNPGEPKSFYDSQPASPGWWRSNFSKQDEDKIQKQKKMFQSFTPPTLYFSQDTAVAPKGASTPATERRGPVPPSPNHIDSILDLKLIDVQVPLILSGGRDGLIKIWR